MEIRPEIVLFMGFLVDFLLIIGTNRVCGHPYGLMRAALAAALAAVYRLGCLVPGFEFLQARYWRGIFEVLGCMVAFGWGKGSGKRYGMLIVLHLALNGIALGFGEGGFWTVAMVALSLCLICLLSMNGRSGGHYLPVVISHGGRTIQLTALADTGNTLRDPISGWPVLVTDSWAAEHLLGLTREQLSDPVGFLTECVNPGLRLIPFHSVGHQNGMLLGIRPDQILVDGRQEEMIVAFAPQPIGQGKAYRALAGGMMV